MGVFDAHVDAGWSAPDRDEDTSATTNCATDYNSVTQHYGACWNYNLGSDADTPTSDGFAGPHVHNSVLTALALTGDGSTYSRVRRISRFVRW
ncbi:MAG: hypothetical protein M5U28_48270 [Sandaracinaceae bacterium]|nr:hypothetical protein [Sandaracinaceae bacterium]